MVLHFLPYPLADKGLLRIYPNRHRNIELTAAPSHSSDALPVIGFLCAGHAIEPMNQIEAVDFNAALMGANRFALRIKDHTLMEEGICEGDVIICERAANACEGQIVAALLNQREMVLKRIHSQSGQNISLAAIHANATPKIYPIKNVEIQGIFIGLIRVL